ncbi:MAG TPA: hypothetical protein VIM07_04065 [Chitinophagaceae bacterium]
MKKNLFFIGFVLLLSLQYAIAQSPTLKTTVDKRQILIGEQLKYNVEATFPVNAYRIGWFNVPDSFSHFEIVTRGKIDTIEKNGLLIYRQTLTLTSFDSGVYTIPALPVNLEPVVSDSAISLFTDSIPINISYSPLDSTKTFHDIKTIIEVKDEIPLWMWIGGAALLILLIVAIIYLIKYLRSRKKPASIFESKLTPIDEALLEIDQLQKEQLLYKGEVKAFHTKLTDIFKRYLSRKWEKNVLNLTSSEILIVLNDTLLSKNDTSLIAGSLRMADAVKFAKFYPHKEESETALSDTKKVIEQIEKLIFTDQHPDTN